METTSFFVRHRPIAANPKCSPPTTGAPPTFTGIKKDTRVLLRTSLEARVLKKLPVNVGVALWGYYLV